MKLFLFCLTLVMFFIGSVSAFMAPRAEGVLVQEPTMRTSSTLNWFWDYAARIGLLAPRTTATPPPVLDMVSPPFIAGVPAPQSRPAATASTPTRTAPPADPHAGEHLHFGWFWTFADRPWAVEGYGYGLEVILLGDQF